VKLTVPSLAAVALVFSTAGAAYANDDTSATAPAEQAALALVTSPALAKTALIDLPFQSEFRLADPFMDVHQRTTERLLACHVNAPTVDIISQPSPVSGYSVIDVADNLGDPAPFFRIRLQQDGESTVVSVGTTLGSHLEDHPNPPLEWLEYWVRGGTTCVKFAYWETVPAL
jgi:hypothetical protein